MAVISAVREARSAWGLVLAGVILVGWSATAWIVLPGADLPRHVALMLLIWLVYVGALCFVVGQKGRGRAWQLAWIFAIALLMRIPFLTTPPSLSDDVYRSVWDARLVHSGINPYDYAPADPTLGQLWDEIIWPRVNHKEQRTPYPPMSEVLGTVAYALLPERLLGMQLVATAFDLATAMLLVALLGKLGMDPRRSLAVAWSPLGAVHFAHSAHHDAAMIAGIVAAALLLTSRRRWLAGIALGFATMIKGLPALLVPLLARAGGARAVIGWLLTCVFVIAPFLGAGAHLAGGVSTEVGTEEFNSTVFYVLRRLGHAAGFESGGAALGTAALAIGTGSAAIAVAALVPATGRNLLVYGLRLFGLTILLAPVVEPWYLTWLAPLIAVVARPGRGRPLEVNDAVAWLWLGGMITLTDLTYLPGGSRLWPLIRLLEYGPTYVLLGYWVWQNRAGHPSVAPVGTRPTTLQARAGT